jgi:hypothetical protein
MRDYIDQEAIFNYLAMTVTVHLVIDAIAGKNDP